MSFTFQLTTLPGGAATTQEHQDDRVLAVVRGRLRVMLEPAGRTPAPPELAWLRASDALSIPAGTAYTVQAMQESEIYLYSDRRTPELWGV